MSKPKDDKKQSEKVRQVAQPKEISSDTDEKVSHKALTDLSSELQVAVNDLENELNEKANEWTETIKQRNESIGTFQGQFSASIATVISKSNEIFSWFFGAIRTVTLWLYAVIILSSAMLGIVYWSLVGATSTQLLIVTLVPAFTLLLLVYLSSKWIRDRIHGESVELGGVQQSIKESLGTFKGKTQSVGIDLSNLQVLKSRLVKVSSQIVATLTSYLVSLREYYEERDKQHEKVYQDKERSERQKNFVRLLRGTILTFAIPVDGKTMEYLDEFMSESDDPDSWIEEAATELWTRNKIDPRIVKLLFFDYTKDNDKLSGVWGSIKNDKTAIEALAKIVVANEVREYINPNETGNFEAIVALLNKPGTFKISNFRTMYYDLYVNLAQMKTSLIKDLTSNGLGINDADRKKVREFPPSSINQREFMEEVFRYVATLLGRDVRTLELLSYERSGETAKVRDIWRKIKNGRENQSVIDELSTVILDNQLTEIPDNYKRQKDVLFQIVRQLIQKQGEFSTAHVRKQFSEIFDGLDVNKKALLLALSRFGILLEPDQAEKFSMFIPKSNNIEELCEELSKLVNESKRIEMEPEFALLFYYHHLQKSEELETFRNLKSKSLSLATVLLQKNVIKEETGRDLALEAQKLAAILDSSEEFDPMLIQKQYQTYSELMTLADKLTQFLQREGLLREANIIFSQLVKILGESGLDTHLSQVKALCKHLLKNFGTASVKKEVFDSIVHASTCYFLVSQQDFAGGEACKEAGSLSTTVKILYRNMELRESETFGKEGATLSSAIDYVISNPTATFRFIEDFTTGLKLERLYPSSRALLGAKVEDLKEQISHASELQATIDSMEQSVREFMNAELPEDFLLYAVDAQLIQAYMVSTQSGQPIMGDILERMKKICSTDSPNAKYKRVLLFTEEKTKGGYYTRMGVVPSRLNFEDFSKLFDEVFKLAVQDYLAESGLPPEQASRFSANVFRLFASPLTFKLITGTPKSPEEIDAVHPIRQIKDVIINQMGFVDNLTLVASSKSERDRTVIVKKIVTNLFDSKGKLLTMIRPGIADILDRHNKLKEIMESRELFDNVLMAKFGCNSFSSLAQATYKMRVSMGDKSKAIDQIGQYVDEIARIQKIHLTPDESKRIGASVEVILDNIGKVLQY